MKSRIEQNHEQHPDYALILPAAQRMRRYRKHRREGQRSVRILLGETDIDAAASPPRMIGISAGRWKRGTVRPRGDHCLGEPSRAGAEDTTAPVGDS
jgi:hypothetical protein